MVPLIAVPLAYLAATQLGRFLGHGAAVLVLPPLYLAMLGAFIAELVYVPTALVELKRNSNCRTRGNILAVCVGATTLLALSGLGVFVWKS